MNNIEIIKTEDPNILIQREWTDTIIELEKFNNELLFLKDSLQLHKEKKILLLNSEILPVLEELKQEKLLFYDDVIRVSEERIKEIELILSKWQSQ